MGFGGIVTLFKSLSDTMTLSIGIAGLFLSASAHAGTLNCNLVSDLSNHATPSVAKPGYLQSITDPVFGTKITRVSGDPGTTVQGVSGAIWGSDVHHQYSKVQAWNADQSLLFLETNHEGGTGSIFVDGQTYQPLFHGSCPGSECRWHPTDATKMFYAGSNRIGYWTVRTNATTVIASFSGYSNLTIGEYEGNLNADGSKVVLMGNNSAGHSIAFIYNLSTNVKSADIDFTALGINADNASLSSKSNYIVINDNNDHIFIFDLNGNLVNKFTEYGRPSHFDMGLDANGEEVVVGVSKSSPDSGKVISRRLRDGAVTVLVSAAYASHSSTRATQLGGWGVSTYNENPGWPPYNSEIITYSLDGSKIYRLAHHHGNISDYEAEIHASPSPDGLRVVFASNWGDSTGRPVQVYVVDLRANCNSPATVDSAPPSVPSGLIATANSPSQINLSWSPATDNVGVVGYRVYRGGVMVADVTSPAYASSGLASSTSYSFSVSAYDAAGNLSAQSLSSSATTLAAPAPVATTMHLDFNNGTSGAGNSPTEAGYVGVPLIAFNSSLGYGWQSISGMDTRYRSSSSDTLQSDFHKTLDSHFLVNLPDGSYAVTAYLGDNDSDLNNMYIAAQGLTVANGLSTNAANRLIKVSFAVQVSGGQLDLRFYTTNAASVYYGYIAVNGLDIVQGGSVQQPTADTTAPSVPTALTAAAASSAQINLTWAASTDDLAVSGYKIFRNGTAIGNATTPSYVDSGLSPSTNYSYSVLAYDASGNNSAQSSAVSATTAVASPTNFVTNSGFESGLTGWNTWGNSVTQTSSVYSGKSSLRTGTRSGGVYQDVISHLTAGSSYTLTFAAKLRSSTDKTGTVGIEFLDSHGTVILDKHITPTSTAWKPLSLTVTCPAGATQALVYVYKNSGGASYIYVDNLSLGP